MKLDLHTRCSGGIAVQHRMAPARGSWLFPFPNKYMGLPVSNERTHHMLRSLWALVAIAARDRAHSRDRAMHIVAAGASSRQASPGTRLAMRGVTWLALSASAAYVIKLEQAQVGTASNRPLIATWIMNGCVLVEFMMTQSCPGLPLSAFVMVCWQTFRILEYSTHQQDVFTP
jgi:hypothetical protein